MARLVVRLLTAMLIAVALTSTSLAAELIMFHDAHCVWCGRFDAEIGPLYGKTAEGQRAPLRRVDAGKPLPPELAFIETERLTPVFVLIDHGREVGRIRGYPGDDHFWGLLGTLLAKLPPER
jgi:hypothetical protein